MIATAVTLAFLGLTLSALVALFRRDADKIVAALGGNSWVAERRDASRPVAVRYAPRPVTMTPSRLLPALRAAA